MTSPILLVGAGGHARACIDVIERERRFTIVGLIGSPDEMGTDVLGYPVIGTDRQVADMRRTVENALVVVGQIKTPEPRMRLYDLLVQGKWRLPTIVSPLSHVSRHARVGAGTIVMHGAIVNAGAAVGANCILNSLSLVEHDAVVGDHTHIATSAVLNSAVRVGTGAFIGSNTSVRQGVTIGDRCVIGMGQRVLVDCAAGTQLPPRSVA